MISARLMEIVATRTPRIEVSIDALADMFTSTVEGGIILARIYDDNQALVAQVQSYRSYLRLLFDDVQTAQFTITEAGVEAALQRGPSTGRNSG